MKLQIAPEIQIIEETEDETELEPLYRVLIHNDHITGIAYVQTIPKSEAEKRINKAHFAAGLEGYPLHFSMEPE